MTTMTGVLLIAFFSFGIRHETMLELQLALPGVM